MKKDDPFLIQMQYFSQSQFHESFIRKTMYISLILLGLYVV